MVIGLSFRALLCHLLVYDARRRLDGSGTSLRMVRAFGSRVINVDIQKFQADPGVRSAPVFRVRLFEFCFLGSFWELSR